MIMIISVVYAQLYCFLYLALSNLSSEEHVTYLNMFLKFNLWPVCSIVITDQYNCYQVTMASEGKDLMIFCQHCFC